MTDKSLADSTGLSLNIALDILAASGYSEPTEDLQHRLKDYIELLAAWAEPLSLVSATDRHHFSAHIADSLSLIPYVAGSAALIDIGSGGGFPAIPIAAACPELPVLLIERSAKKAGFLRKVVARLRLIHTGVCHGAFPDAWQTKRNACITARAVEAPDVFYPALRAVLTPGQRLLYQGAPPPTQYFPLEWLHGPIEDAWSARGLRRGTLWRVEPIL